MDNLFKDLTEVIKKSNQVVIMVHKNPDLDALGSAISLYQIVKHLKKQCFIVFPNQNKNKSVDKSTKLLEKNNININFINNNECEKLIKDDNLLIILDVSKPKMLENQNLLKMRNIVVIDHHISHKNLVLNTIYKYIDETKSSIVEIMTEYLKYLNIKLNPIILTIMLAGLEVDTNAYSYKTTEKTFKAAAYLTKNGANISQKNQILKISKEEIIKINNYINNSFFIKEGFIISNANNIEDISEIAVIADKLLKIDNVQAAFVIGKTKDKIVHISARSMGNISVEKILNKIGGGGHITAAAAEIKNKTIEEVMQILKNIILEG